MKGPSRLGRYEIRGELGRGAMGVVYEGFDVAIERVVAIKVLQLDQVTDATMVEVRTRFRREAQAAARLGHRHIVGVFEYSDGDAQFGGSAAGPYIVMEHVAGRTLKALFEAHTRFTLAETLRLMGELLAALQHAHERGVVHRDIKPSNLMVHDGGPPYSLKVTDFGIARLDSSDLTLSGATLGTASHMSPEQFLGQPVDRRTDLYACGVILYQLLTDDLPFSGSPSTIMQKVLNQDVLAPSALNPTLSPLWDAILRKALAKKPEDRFASADAFATAIRAASISVDPDATVLRPAPAAAMRKPSHRTVVAGVVAIFVAVGTLGAFVASQRPAVPAIDGTASSPAAASVAVATKATGEPVPAPTSPTPAPAPSAEEIEQQAWADALAADNTAAYRAFLQGYPKGRFAGRAQVRIAVLEPRSASAAATPMTPAAHRAVPASSPTTLAVAPPAPPAVAPAASVAQAKSAAPSRQACQDDQDVDQRCALILGYFYLADGKDLLLAMKWFRAGADQGDAEAQFELGLMYFLGRGVGRDHSTGFAWMKKAADQGFAKGENMIGNCFERGDGVLQNSASAVEWFSKSADHGYSHGQNNLGRMLLSGRGVPRDPARAEQMFRRAAAQGNAYAAHSLGRLFEKGEELVKVDRPAATRWYRAALESGLETTVRQDPWGDTKLIEHVKAFIAANP